MVNCILDVSSKVKTTPYFHRINEKEAAAEDKRREAQKAQESFRVWFQEAQ
jgi:hypothetical protein